MRQNIGLFLLTFGSILLGANFFRWGLVADRKSLTRIERWFYALSGGETFWEASQKKNDNISKLLSGATKKSWRTERTPVLVAVALMLIGFALSLDYSVLSRLWISIFG